jgi:hypothetical protein
MSTINADRDLRVSHDGVGTQQERVTLTVRNYQ